MESVIRLTGEYIFEVASLLIAMAALIYAALAFRVSKQALETAAQSDFAKLKLKASEGRAKVDRSFLLLQSACRDMRNQWDVHHDRYFPKLGALEHRQRDVRHIAEVENEGRRLLTPLTLDLSKSGTMDAAALEEYIKRADQTALRIEQLTLRLSPPKQLFA